MGLIYTLGALSFRDARPREAAERHYQESDDWTVGDLLRNLHFEYGQLHFHADYVRGRMMKTTIDIDREGKIILTTVNRGEAATRWIARLQGKKIVGLVGDGPDAGVSTESPDRSLLS